MSLPLTDTDEFRAVGHGIIGLVNMAILLAIAAVILSANSQTPNIIRAAFDLITWLVSQVVRPLSGGTNETLSDKLAPAGSTQSTQPG